MYSDEFGFQRVASVIIHLRFPIATTLNRGIIKKPLFNNYNSYNPEQEYFVKLVKKSSVKFNIISVRIAYKMYTAYI